MFLDTPKNKLSRNPLTHTFPYNSNFATFVSSFVISQYHLPKPWIKSNRFWKKAWKFLQEGFLHLPLNLCKITPNAIGKLNLMKI